MTQEANILLYFILPFIGLTCQEVKALREKAWSKTNEGIQKLLYIIFISFFLSRINFFQKIISMKIISGILLFFLIDVLSMNKIVTLL